MIVAWSGGCDSTLAAVLAAKELQAKGESGPVRLLTVVHPQVPALAEAERARRALLSRLRKLKIARVKWRFDHTVVTLRQQGPLTATTAGSGLIQPLLWLGVVMSYLERDETLVMGYIKGDDFWHHQDDFVAAYGALQRVSGRSGRLWFPLEWTPKAEVIRDLKQCGLYARCWYCEDPVYRRLKAGERLRRDECGRACGKCHACVTHRTGRWQLEQGLVGPSPESVGGESVGGESVGGEVEVGARKWRPGDPTDVKVSMSCKSGPMKDGEVPNDN